MLFIHWISSALLPLHLNLMLFEVEKLPIQIRGRVYLRSFIVFYLWKLWTVTFLRYPGLFFDELSREDNFFRRSIYDGSFLATRAFWSANNCESNYGMINDGSMSSKLKTFSWRFTCERYFFISFSYLINLHGNFDLSLCHRFFFLYFEYDKQLKVLRKVFNNYCFRSRKILFVFDLVIFS